MIQVRYGLFETNSSSTMTFAVDICQVVDIEIPPIVEIDTTVGCWDNNVSSVYNWAQYRHNEKEFLGLLAHSGVKEIYIDGKLTIVDPDNYHITFTRPEIVIARSFGDFKNFSEWQGHGGEWDCSQYLTKEQIKLVQDYIKNPNYIVICMDEDGNELDWASTRYSKMVITDEEIEAEKEYLANKKKYDEDIESKYNEYEDYEDYENETIEDLQEEDDSWEDDDFYLTKKNRHNKKKNRKK